MRASRRGGLPFDGAPDGLIDGRNASGSGSGERVGAIAVRVLPSSAIGGIIGVVSVVLTDMTRLRIRVVQLMSPLHPHVPLGAVAVGRGLEIGQFLDPC